MTQDTDVEVATYNWSPQRYIDLVEHTKYPMLQEYQRVELDYLTSQIQSPREKTFIDVGAGYGRVLPQLASTGGEVVAVEVDQEMLGELRRRTQEYSNVQVIEGDANHLTELLEGKGFKNPVILLLQNTLGTWKGNYHKVLEEMKKVAQENHGEIIVSLLRQEAFESEAVPMYETLEELVGEPDLERTDPRKGIFKSKTNYKSKWWTVEEREDVAKLLGGKKVQEITNPAFWILHTSYGE